MCGGQPARLYGLAKVQKKDCRLRPVLSMPGTMYELLSKELASIINKLPQAKISCNAQEINRNLGDLKLNDEEQLISLDVVSLLTNVPVDEAIDYTAELLFEQEDAPELPFDRDTFVTLLRLVTKDVIFATNHGNFKQIDGVAMGSSVGPLLANIFMSKYDKELGSFSPFYYRYIDDILLLQSLVALIIC